MTLSCGGFFLLSQKHDICAYAEVVFAWLFISLFQELLLVVETLHNIKDACLFTYSNLKFVCCDISKVLALIMSGAFSSPLPDLW